MWRGRGTVQVQPKTVSPPLVASLLLLVTEMKDLRQWQWPWVGLGWPGLQWALTGSFHIEIEAGY